MVHLGLIAPLLSATVLEPENRRRGIWRDILADGSANDLPLKLENLFGIERVADGLVVQAALNALVCHGLA